MNYADMLASLQQQNSNGARGLMQPAGDVVNMPVFGQTGLNQNQIAQLREIQRRNGLSDNQIKHYIAAMIQGGMVLK